MRYTHLVRYGFMELKLIVVVWCLLVHIDDENGQDPYKALLAIMACNAWRMRMTGLIYLISNVQQSYVRRQGRLFEVF